MKRAALIISLALLCQAIGAQTHRDSLVINRGFFNNTFISSGIGCSAIWNTHSGIKTAGYPSLTFDISLGKWITPNIGVRVGYQGYRMIDQEVPEIILPGANYSYNPGSGYCNTRYDFSYVHADLMWNLNNSLWGYKDNRLWNISPYLHVGYIWLYNNFAQQMFIKGDYCGGIGIINDFRIYDRLSLFLDLRTSTAVRHTYNTGGTGESSTMRGLSFYGMAGVTYNFSKTVWDKAGKSPNAGYGMNKFFDNTWIGIAYSTASWIAPGEGVNGPAIFEPGAEITLGKWFTPHFGARIGAGWNMLSRWTTASIAYKTLVLTDTYIENGQVYGKGSFAMLSAHGDLMWNATNTIGGYREHRLWNVYPYLTAQAGFSYNYQTAHSLKGDFMLGIGLDNSFAVTRRFAIDLDVRAYYVEGRAISRANQAKAVMPIINIGAVYNFKPVKWEYCNAGIPWKKGLDTKYESRKFTPTYLLNSGRFHDNTSLTVSTGVNILWNGDSNIEGSTMVAPAVDLSFTKWVTPVIGFKIGVLGSRLAERGNNPGGDIEAVKVSGSYSGGLIYAEQLDMCYPHIDFLMNLANIKYDPNRKYEISVYGHTGYMMSFSTNNEQSRLFKGNFAGGAGLIGAYKVGKKAHVNLDMKFTAVNNSSFGDGKTGMGMFASSLIGFTYDFGTNKWTRASDETTERCKGEKGKNKVGFLQSKRFFDYTFIEVQGGFMFSVDGSLPAGRPWTPSGAFAVNFGKWITPHFAARIGYQGLSLTQWGENPTEMASFTPASEGELKREKINYHNLHLDFMANMNNIIAGYKPDRVYEAIPYATIGANLVSKSTGGKVETNCAAGIGFLNQFNLGNRLGINVDLKATTFNGQYMDQNSNGNAIAFSVLAGLTYKLGEQEWHRGVVPFDPETPEERAVKDNDRAIALSTNVLGYADLGTLNLEFQYALNRHYSISAIGKVNAWIYGQNSDKESMNKKVMVSLGLKYWPWMVYSGWWVRPFLQTEAYSCANLYEGMRPQRGNRYGMGISLGYSLIINKWFNIDLGAGLWGGYKTCTQFESASMEKAVTRTASGFLAPADVSISAMFVF